MEINAANPALKVEILGLNRISDAQYNGFIGRTTNILPWLQDTAEQDVWERWNAAYRDVVILDPFNRPIGRYNLTRNDLLNASKRNALKQMLLDAAVTKDSDQDGLPDVWETFWFGNTNSRATEDPDGDQIDNRTEFLFASKPTDATSRPLSRPSIVRPGGKPALTLTFRRFAGSTASFVVETSSDLLNWSKERSAVFQVGSLVNLYDGTGSAEMRFQQSSAAGALPSGFIRVTPQAP